MKPNFALTFTDEGISLMHRTARGWLVLGEGRIDDPALPETIGFLRTTALGLEPNGIGTKLFLPDSQIRFTTVEVTATEPARRRSQIKRALEGLTPYAVEDLVFDWSGTGSTVQVAVIARETLDEAEAFARDHRLNPLELAARPSPGRFDGSPHFGPTAAALSGLPKGKKPEIVRENLPILGQPESAVLTASDDRHGEMPVLAADTTPVAAPVAAAEPAVDLKADAAASSPVEVTSAGLNDVVPAAPEPLAMDQKSISVPETVAETRPETVPAAIKAPETPADRPVDVVPEPALMEPEPRQRPDVAAVPDAAVSGVGAERFSDPSAQGPDPVAQDRYADLRPNGAYMADDIPEAPAMFDVPLDESDFDEPVAEPLPQAKFATRREPDPFPASGTVAAAPPEPVASRMAFAGEPRDALPARAGFADTSAEVNAPNLPKTSLPLPPLVAPVRGLTKAGAAGRVADPRAKVVARDTGKAASGMARFVPMKQKAAKSAQNRADATARIAGMTAAIAAPTRAQSPQDPLRPGIGSKPAQQRGKPRYLGLVLTLILVAALVAAALWATFLQDGPAVRADSPADGATTSSAQQPAEQGASVAAGVAGADPGAPLPLAAADTPPTFEGDSIAADLPTDVGPTDAGLTDAGPTYAGPTYAGPTDAALPDAGLPDAGLPDANQPDLQTADAASTDPGLAQDPLPQDVASTAPLPDTVRPLPRPARPDAASGEAVGAGTLGALASLPVARVVEPAVSGASSPATGANPAPFAALPSISSSGNGGATEAALPQSSPEGTANANLAEPAGPGQSNPDPSPHPEAAQQAVVVADPAAAAPQPSGQATALAEPAQGADGTPTLPAIPAPGAASLAGRDSPAPLVPPQTAENDTRPSPPVPPAPFGVFFDRDAGGFVIATPQGALTPEGAVIFAGRPKLVPPARLPPPAPTLADAQAVAAQAVGILTSADADPSAATGEPAPVSADPGLQFFADPALLGLRPKPRPSSLAAPGDQTLLSIEPMVATADTPRPKPRTAGQPGASGTGASGTSAGGASETGATQAGQGLADRGTTLQDQAAAIGQTDAFAQASRLAVSASKRPSQRPVDFSASVTAALAAAAPTPEPLAAATPEIASPAPAPRPEVPVVKVATKPEAAADPEQPAADEGDAEPELASAAPSIPTRASVAKQATEKNAISLSVVNLIGVYGSTSDRHALVRLPSGKYLRLKVGDRVDGGKVAAIGDQELRYIKNGRNLILALPKEG